MTHFLYVFLTMYAIIWAIGTYNKVHDPTWRFSHPSEVELVIEEAVK